MLSIYNLIKTGFNVVKQISLNSHIAPDFKLQIY